MGKCKGGQVLPVERAVADTGMKTRVVSSYYGEDTFGFKVMEAKLPRDIYKKLLKIINDGEKLDLDTANAVAHAMKEWAIEKGATHYCHWFQPMTGSTAEKHDSFADPVDVGSVIERFSGKQLIQGEPDASSFPSGGLRATFEARGYTAWDLTSPAFVIRNGNCVTLSIPTAFVSYTGEALDKKTPLLRSIKAVDKSARRLAGILGNKSIKRVTATLGPEQEYFLIDQDFYYKRADLVMANRTLFGAAPAKGQQLEDQYFGPIKERIISYMSDVEEELYRLGIPAKTRHNEVAPAQYELAPVFEDANIAVDHNHLVMETMRRIARRHNFALLLHEKPFAGINGSGKHLNWSLSDDLGNNFLNPGNTPHENLQFLVFLTAIIRAVYVNADILRSTVASAGNDHRLGANEAPPAIISIFLGDQLAKVVEFIEKGTITSETDPQFIDFGVSTMPLIAKDNTDRNRTSPFAFTGNKFEFRAVGSSMSISWPTTVLNAIVTESLDYIADAIEKKGGDIKKTAFEVMKEVLKESNKVIFNDNNYSKEWEVEAGKRGLPNNKNTPDALKALGSDKAKKLFSKYGILTEVEVGSRYNIAIERYIKEMEIEACAMYDMAMNQIIPSGIAYQTKLAESISKTEKALGTADNGPQKDILKKVSSLVSLIAKSAEALKAAKDSAHTQHDEPKIAEFYCKEVKAKMEALRTSVDELEVLVEDKMWSLSKYWEMLFVF
jgi:glutamine synthetase